MDTKNTFAVIFDMDGVLIDSIAHIWESFNRLVEPLDIHFDEASIRKYLGHSIRDQVAMWKEDYGIDVGNEHNFSLQAMKIQNELMANSEPNIELLQLLQSLKERNVPLAVGTSSSRARAEDMLAAANIEQYFDALVTADEVAEHKPNPHIFLEAARQIHTPPLQCVVIEDAATGIRAAKNGNMKSIGFLTKWNSREELYEADKLVTSFKELSYGELAQMFLK
jgi:HAD superfamily hydrolase (TIGR01509 family)